MLDCTPIKSGLPKQSSSFLIYDGEGIPDPTFNSVCITLKADPKSSLDWTDQKKRAEALIEKGFVILWELDFGLREEIFFDELIYKTVEFSLTYFIDTILTPHISQTIGVLLMRVNENAIPFEMLRAINAFFPDSSSLFLAYEDSGVIPLFDVFKTLCSEDLEHFQLILKGRGVDRFPYALPCLGWGRSLSPLGNLCSIPTPLLPVKPLRVAMVLPSLPTPLFDEALEILEERQISFLIVPQHKITTSWEGIDYFITFPAFLSRQGYRKLLGFCAAGGVVISMGENEWDFPNVLSFDEFLRSYKESR